jgi:hypothetical protein
MRNAETVLGVMHRSLESCLRSKDSRAVWRGAVGKGPQGTSLAAYPTVCPVRGGTGRKGSNDLARGLPYLRVRFQARLSRSVRLHCPLEAKKEETTYDTSAISCRCAE